MPYRTLYVDVLHCTIFKESNSFRMWLYWFEKINIYIYILCGYQVPGTPDTWYSSHQVRSWASSPRRHETTLVKCWTMCRHFFVYSTFRFQVMARRKDNDFMAGSEDGFFWILWQRWWRWRRRRPKLKEVLRWAWMSNSSSDKSSNKDADMLLLLLGVTFLILLLLPLLWWWWSWLLLLLLLQRWTPPPPPPPRNPQ